MSEIEVPNNWDYPELGEICDEIYRYPTYYGIEYVKSGIPEIRGELIKKDGSINSDPSEFRFISNETCKKFPKTILKENDLVMTVRGTIGKVAKIPKNLAGANITANLMRISPKSEVCFPPFLLFFFKSKYFLDEISERSSLTTIATIKAPLLKSIKVPLPSLKIQMQIVQKLDYVLGELEEKKKDISELQASKIKHIKILSDKTIGNIISKLMHLDSSPDSWDIQKIENICQDIQPGFADGKKDVKDGVIHLRMNNIGTNFDLNFGLIRTIEANKDKLKKYQLKQGDVIFNNTNSSKLVGKSAIFNDSKVCLYSNHLTRLRVKKELVLPEWLLFYFRARWLNGDFERMCNKWINQAAVNNNKIKNLEIPVPNLKIQKKIVESLSNVSKNIEAIRTISESILRQEKINLNHFKNLSSKITDVAFSGKLVN